MDTPDQQRLQSYTLRRLLFRFDPRGEATFRLQQPARRSAEGGIGRARSLMTIPA